MKKHLFLFLVSVPLTTLAAPLSDYSFKSPAFNGVGYSSHVLTIENQEYTRQKSVRDAIQAKLDKELADKANTNMSKFLNNLESRIYAQISQNLAAAMFKDGGSDAGTFVMSKNADGTPMTWMEWTKSSTDITMTVYQPGVPPTTITVPLGQFQF
jgi:hypothetical protein